MSALNRIKGILLFQMKGSPIELKKAILKVVNSIDSDLDVEGYTPSSDVTDAFEELDKVLVEMDELANNPAEDDDPILITRTRLPKPEEDSEEEG